MMTLNELKAKNKEIGHSWFSEDTMRFFNSIPESDTLPGNLFITSERYSFDHPKLYTVRKFQDTGHVSNASDFQEFETLDAAKKYADKLAEKLKL